MFPEQVETDSLDLIQMSLANVDVFGLYDLFGKESKGTEDVFEYIPQEPFTTIKDAQEWLAVAESEWEDRESARYLVFRSDGTLVGLTVLSLEWNRKKGDLAVILAKPYWGNGYAQECAMVLTELAFDRLDLEVVTLGYDEGNDRSKAAIESFIDRVDGQYDGVTRNATRRGNRVVDAHNYSVTKEQYRQE